MGNAMKNDARYSQLVDHLAQLGGAAIAFSGGVDSTFLLKAAKDALPQRTLAVIGRSATYPAREYEAAVGLAQMLSVEHQVVDTDELSKIEFRTNPPDRCFHCKQTLFSAIWVIARQKGLEAVLEGSNADDVSDYRPGRAAAEQLAVRSPLVELGFAKTEIRELSKALGLPTWNKPAMACLSSRIPYGSEITEARLRRIEQAEDAINALGIAQFRVRDHDTVARIEVGAAEIPRLADPAMREPLLEAVKAAGYSYVCLDLEGYRQGAMNEVIDEAQAAKPPPRGK
jgi:uncharacterized protein